MHRLCGTGPCKPPLRLSKHREALATTIGHGEYDHLRCPTCDDIGDGEGVQTQEEPEEETEPLNEVPDPSQPAEKQVEEHRTRGHLPFGLWCRRCCLERGRSMPHHAEEGSVIPIVGLDYFLLTAAGVQLREDMGTDDEVIQAARSRGEAAKCSIARCHKSRVIFAHVVPCTGADEQGIVADMVVYDIDWLGQTPTTLNADNGPPAQALARQALELAKVEGVELEHATHEGPPASGSQANGGTEVGVRVTRGMLRTLKLRLGQRLDKHIPVDHPVVAWLLEHACMLLTAAVRGDDGATAWMRIRGRPFAQHFVGFGEPVLHKCPTKWPRHNPHGNVGALGADGAFLGVNRYSNTSMVWTGNECIPVRPVTRKPSSDRRVPDAIADVSGCHGKRRILAGQLRVRFGTAPLEHWTTANEAAPTAPRAMRIDRSDRGAHGYDADCGQCKHILTYKRPRSGTRRSTDCRQRTTKAMEETDAGRARLANNNGRLDRTRADQVECRSIAKRLPNDRSPHPRRRAPWHDVRMMELVLSVTTKCKRLCG